MSATNRLVVLIGSVRQGRFGSVVARWAAEQAVDHGGFEVDAVDFADIDIPLTLPAESPELAGDAYPALRHG